MSDQSYDKLIRQARKSRLIPEGKGVALSYGVAEVERILPHRPPMRLVNGLTQFDPETRTLVGSYFISPDDPILKGHFPGYPVYPGMLQVEAMGQLSICCAYFLRHHTTDIPVDAKPLDVRALKVHHATFLGEVRPGDAVTLVAQAIEETEMIGISLGQFIVNNKVCSVSIGEVYFPKS